MSNQFWSGWRPSQDAPALLLGQAVETQDCYVMSSFPHQAISGSQSDERDPVKVVPNPFHQFKRYLLLLTRPVGSPSPGHHNQNLVLSAAARQLEKLGQALGTSAPLTDLGFYWLRKPTWLSIGLSCATALLSLPCFVFHRSTPTHLSYNLELRNISHINITCHLTHSMWRWLTTKYTKGLTHG